MSALRLSFDGGGTVTSLEAIPFALPFSSPYVTSRGTLYRREAILVRVRTSEGLVGLGEAVPLSLRGGDPIAQVHAELLRIGAWLERCAGHPHAGASVLAGLVKDSSPPTRCAVLTAWLDLAGKAENPPAGLDSAERPRTRRPGSCSGPSRPDPCAATQRSRAARRSRLPSAPWSGQ